jgi:acyl-CoA oxidase
LFGGTVLKLGTAKHHGEFLTRIDRLQSVGCFALTELGFGNNAVEMQTTAIYDAGSGEFVVNTPTVRQDSHLLVRCCVPMVTAHLCQGCVGSQNTGNINLVAACVCCTTVWVGSWFVWLTLPMSCDS